MAVVTPDNHSESMATIHHRGDIPAPLESLIDGFRKRLSMFVSSGNTENRTAEDQSVRPHPILEEPEQENLGIWQSGPNAPRGLFDSSQGNNFNLNTKVRKHQEVLI